MSVIDDYLKNVPAAQKVALERVRAIVKQTAPDAEEAISYGMPAFKFKQKYLIGFAAYKKHLSIFPSSGPIAAISKKLTKFQTSKGTVQFTEDNPIPEDLIKEMIMHRLTSIEKNE